MLFLLEIQQFDKFNRVCAHANRVMDEGELKALKQLFNDFQKAVNGTKATDQFENLDVDKYQPKKENAKTQDKISNLLGNILKRRVTLKMQAVPEEEEDDNDNDE